MVQEEIRWRYLQLISSCLFNFRCISMDLLFSINLKLNAERRA